MKFNPIGSTFKEGNVTLKVKVSKDEGRTCTGCWYAGFKGPTSNKKKELSLFLFHSWPRLHSSISQRQKTSSIHSSTINMNQNQELKMQLLKEFGIYDEPKSIDFCREAYKFLVEGDMMKVTVDKQGNTTIERIPIGATDTPVAVDLGLPSGTLWCDRNVGSKSPSDCGAFFSWGNTEPHYPKLNMDWGDDDEAFDFLFNWDNYEKSEGYKLEGNIDLAHDAARVNMGEPWQMPTSDQFQELYDNCTWERKTVDGVNGYLVTSKINGNSIFFACSGSALARRGAIAAPTVSTGLPRSTLPAMLGS